MVNYLKNCINQVNEAWDKRTEVTPKNNLPLKELVQSLLDQLDRGGLRIAECKEGQWQVHQWLKKIILLSFRLNENFYHPEPLNAYDKVPLKFAQWKSHDFEKAAIRAVPGSIVRFGAYVGPNVVLMPSFINIGAFVGKGTMIDTWATVGSCAQVGENCHISGGVGLGGVLEPLQANPVIIEDDCFIGARSEIVEGVIVQQGAVIGMGVFIGASTPILNRLTGEVSYGKVPPYSVVISGSMPGKTLNDGPPSHYLNCAVIIKQVDEKTRSKTSVNDLLRP